MYALTWKENKAQIFRTEKAALEFKELRSKDIFTGNYKISKVTGTQVPEELLPT